MIPRMNLIAWGNVVPWAELRQVEQDLIICRALIELFTDPFLAEQLRFRGGTALNKLHFPVPLRYSEDIDLVRTTPGAIGPILDRIRERLEPWLGKANFDGSPVSPKLKFRVPSEDPMGGVIRLKVEINTTETRSYDEPQTLPLAVENPWFSGRAKIPTFSREEMLATKLRALLQRNKGRDLFELAHALSVFETLNPQRVVECLGQYLQPSGLVISRAMAEERMFAKLQTPGFLSDVRPLLAAGEAERLTETGVQGAFAQVFFGLIVRIPGETWSHTEEMKAHYGVQEPAAN